MDLGFLFNRLTQTIDKNRPAEPEPVVFISSGDKQEEVIPNRSPRWQRSTKRIVIVGLAVLALLCVIFLRNMITPMILSCLMVFYLKPVVRSIQRKTKTSYKGAVIIVFVVFLIVILGALAIGGYSLYGQVKNLFDLLNTSVDNLPTGILKFLGGPDSFFGGLYLRFFGMTGGSELNQQIQNFIQKAGGSSLGFLQSFSSRIGWFFFVYGFSFFVIWESRENEEKPKIISIPGYEYDLEMGAYHLSLIWKRFLWGQAMLMLITLVVYFFLFVVLGVRYAFILACVTALTQLVPYIGSFFAWAAVALVALSQGTTIFHMQPLPYAILVVVLAFLIDKFKDGFIQPKFLAETLKVHPAAVLAAALISARFMGFLGVFLAAPLVATLQLAFRYVMRKLRDEDPWVGIETVDEPVPLKEYLAEYKAKILKIYDKLNYHIGNLWSRLLGGKGHGTNGY